MPYVPPLNQIALSVVDLRRTERWFREGCGLLAAGGSRLMMRGALFSPQSGDLLTTVIYYGGFVGNLLSGILYFLSVWLGYAQPDVAGHVHDYGTKFLVAAGLLNLLAMVDAYEIAAGRKD